VEATTARDGFERRESNDSRGKITSGFRTIVQSDTTVRQNMGRTFWRLATDSSDGEYPRPMLIQGGDMRGIDLRG
jgi:hypothetical protein